MDSDDYFAEDYQRARGKFLSACRKARLLPQAYRASRDDGERENPLADSIRLGDPAARRMLVVCGGDRAVDALCCSAIEVGWLSEFGGASLPHDTAILLVHHGAVPPTGADLPRRDEPLPEWEDDLLTKVEQRYAEYAREKGVDSMGRPLAGSDRRSMAGYPGAMLDSLANWLGSAADGRIAVADIRVGLGPYGEAEITPCHPPDSAGARRVRSWFGLPEPPEKDGIAPQDPDNLAAGLIDRLPHAEVTAFSASFGTYSMMSVLETLSGRPKGQAVPDPRPLLFPDDAAWRSAVWRSAVVVLQRALSAIHSG